MTAAVLADYRTAPVSPHVRAMLTYLEKVTLQPEQVTVDDARALKQAGVSKAAAEDALFVAACFNQLVRAADTLGWAVPEKAGFDASAGFLLKAGYVLPLGTRK